MKVITIIILSLLFLVSCTGSSNHGQSSGSDTAFNKLAVNIPVRKNRAIDFARLYGKWAYISNHFSDTTRILTGKPVFYKNDGDSNIHSFLSDTALFDMSRANFIDFNSAGKWHEFAGEGKDSGKYRIDKAISVLFKSCRMTPMNCCDSVYLERVIYLDDKYMLMVSMLPPNETMGRKIITFLKKVSK